MRSRASERVKIFTCCPSCPQGLKRYDEDADPDADYIVVEIVRHILGGNRMPANVARQHRQHRAAAGLSGRFPSATFITGGRSGRCF